MNEALIRNINATVSMNDELYILGDLSFKTSKADVSKYLDDIYCKNLYLINGNHDKDWSGDEHFKEVCDYKVLKLGGEVYEGGEILVLFHYPILDWRGKGHKENNSWSVHLHGHIHSRGSDLNYQNFLEGNYRYDVGVDANDYRPISADAILSLR
jgi:calcineurin-like phosphoesterase family protein